MMNCRAISRETWEHARKALLFYFSQRMAHRAEDLVQETLAELWRRDDYMFESEDQFLRVCYGFARNILSEARRHDRERISVELPEEFAPPSSKVLGLTQVELGVLLDQVWEKAKTQLRPKDWNVIHREIEPGDGGPEAAKEGNARRVSLHRARKKLTRLIGFDPEL